jgi:folylpolyglutamate synthase/dihydrofolate synthase
MPQAMSPVQFGYPAGHPIHGLHGQNVYGHPQQHVPLSYAPTDPQSHYPPSMSSTNAFTNGYPSQPGMQVPNDWSAQPGSNGSGRHSVPALVHQSAGPAYYASASASSSTGGVPQSGTPFLGSSAPMPNLSHTGGVGKIDLGLQRMTALMQLLSPLRTPAIHLSGTNGKGSVSAMLESIFRCAGFRTARYNSPHLLEPRDAIALNGQAPSPEEYYNVLAHVQALSRTHDIQATTFEIATATAYEVITRFGADVMIIECGMGGIGDATNVIPPQLILASGLTSVGLDHTAFLGDTLEAITSKKAGIAVKDGLMVIGPQRYNGVARIAMHTAQANGARTLCSDRALDLTGKKSVLDLAQATRLPTRRIRVQTHTGGVECELGLAGECQLDNASLAINIIAAIRADHRALAIMPRLKGVRDGVVAAGMRQTRWKGRCELLRYSSVPGQSGNGMAVLVDGAHNSDSARGLRKYIDSLGVTSSTSPVAPTGKSGKLGKSESDHVAPKITWILGLSDSKGKTIESVLEPLIRPEDDVLTASFSPVEGMPWVQPVKPEVVAAAAANLSGKRVEVCRNVSEALAAVERSGAGERGLVVVAGSLYLVADFYRLLPEHDQGGR